eukprot:CCRYP_019733-RB/>CCRYP_019733-RB protein AED:0.10 eAED:0.10 QI:0/0.66/0.75/1/0.33/0/4/590/173
MEQIKSWLTDGDVQRLVVVVSGIDSGKTLERLQFNVSVEDGKLYIATSGRNDENLTHNVIKASGDRMKAERREVGYFLTSTEQTLLFRPVDIHQQNRRRSKEVGRSDPQYILNSQEVKLRSFMTSVSLYGSCLNCFLFHSPFLRLYSSHLICVFQFHKVDSMVTYKEADEWEL